MNKSLGLYNLIDEEGINRSIQNVINRKIDFNTYGSPKGLKELRIKIAEFLHDAWNYQGDDKNILITTGSQQSINLITYSHFKKSVVILVEQPTYFGALDVFKKVDCKLVGVNLTTDGLNLSDLEEKIREYQPRAIYVTPTFNNPTGLVWSNRARKEFLDLINKYNVLVIEDDPYHFINYTDNKYRTLYEMNDGQNIIYLGTFSKLISPSINVGYIICDEDMMKSIYDYKNSFDLSTSLFIQYVVLDYLSNNNLLSIIDNKIPVYKELFNKSIKELNKEDIEYYPKLQGGIFYLVKFKDKIDLDKYESINKYFIDGNYSKMTRINICSYK